MKGKKKIKLVSKNQINMYEINRTKQQQQINYQIKHVL